MVAHHESAPDMAEAAEEQGEDLFVTRLAAVIGSVQAREIAEIKRIPKRRFGTALEADPNGHDGLGLSAAEAGRARRITEATTPASLPPPW